jgi:hypothetical protein
MLRALAIVFGIVIAAIGGVMAYRALFLEPSSALLITNGEVREVPNTLRVAGGIALLIAGASVAFLMARKTRS